MNMLTKLRLSFISFLELLVMFLAYSLYSLTKVIYVRSEDAGDTIVFCIFIVLMLGIIGAVSGNELAEGVYQNMEIRNRKKEKTNEWVKRTRRKNLVRKEICYDRQVYPRKASQNGH